MATIDVKVSQLSDQSNNPLIGDRQSNVADPASTLTATLTAPAPAALSAAAAAAVTIAYGTDDPSTTTDGEINIADGDATALVTTEVHIAIEELVAAIAVIVTLVNELRTDHATSKTLQDELIVDHATFITDITQNRTGLEAVLDVLEEHGLMAAS